MNADREQIYSGLSHAAWGYFFLHIHFNLNTVDILPVFAGWLLLLSACHKLSGERRDLALLRPLCVLLAAWNALDWLLSWTGGGVDGHILFLDLLIAAASLYFHFQFLTDMAVLAGQYQPEGDNLDQRLRRRRAAYTVLCTAMSVCLHLPAGWLEEERGYAMIGLLAVTIVVTLFIMGGLFGLRRCFRETETAA